MLPKFLFDSYVDYKANTDCVISWLVDTARLCGWKSSITTLHTQAKRKGRRGKAGKQPQKAKSTQEVFGEQPGVTLAAQHTVPVKDLTMLAQTIASFSERPVLVPASIIAKARKAIVARTECFNWFHKQVSQDGGLPDDNDKHWHFIGVLGEVLRTLEPCCAVKDSGSNVPSGTKGNVATEKLNNKFEALDIEEPSMEQLEPADLDKPDTASKTHEPEARSSTRAMYQAESSEDEALFELFCFFRDCDRVRTFIKGTWSDYQQRRLDLQTASVITHTAICTIRQAESNFRRDFKSRYPNRDITDYHSLSQPLYEAVCRVRHEEPDKSSEPNDFMNMAMFDVGCWMLLPCAKMLDQWHRWVIVEKRLVWRFEDFQIYDSPQEHFKLSPRQQFQNDRVILFKTLREIVVIMVQHVRSGPVEDEFIKGVRKHWASKTLDMWVVFAAQVSLDIHHIMGQDVVRGIEELKAASEDVLLSTKSYFEFAPSWPTAWKVQNDDIIRFIQDEINCWMMSDALALEKEKASPHLRQLLGPPGPGYYLFSQNPLICGLLMFKWRSRMQEGGLCLVNMVGSLLNSGHLYNALRRTGNLSIEWPDMERVISLHSPERFFMGGRPTKPEDCWMMYYLIIGYSVQAFSRNRRNHLPLRKSKRGPRKLDDPSPILTMFRHCYCYLEPIDIVAAKAEALLYERTTGRKAGENSQRSRDLQRQWVESKNAPMAFLGALRDALAQEISAGSLCFDYFSLQLRSWRLLDELHREFPDELRREMGQYEKVNLGKVATLIIVGADEAQPEGEEIRLIAGGSHRVLARAGQIYKRFVEREGDVECRRREERRTFFTSSDGRVAGFR
ncbi:hypothetical protein MMC20_005107 [Loxospora ochrophaea]|nr:hypothetical protein [Loxospora ochrophaea]